ncbi:MAG: CU044_5270 family protein [Solirubrobacterales bacterium]
MDELTLMRDFHAERVKEDPAARAAAWRALEARFDPGPAPAVVAPARRRRSLFSRRRRLFGFAGATALAAAVAGIFVLSSGPTAQPAAAEILHETAAVAAAGDAAAAIPGPGQFLFTKFKRLELEGWIAGGPSPEEDTPGQVMGSTLSRRDAFNALVATTQEWWTGQDGAGRIREVADTPRFLTEREEDRWEAAGSPLPAPFDPAYQRRFPLAFGDALEVRRGVVDREASALKGYRFPDTSNLPTEPQELRRAVESNQIPLSGFSLMYPAADRLDTDQTIAELFNILQEGNPMRPQLRAAIFNALAELPGIEVDTDATDLLGRQGYAISSVEAETGVGLEYVFDPGTAELLAQRNFISETGRNPALKGLPAGQTIRETAYLESGVVDSTRESSAEAESGGPLATTEPTYRK